MRNFLKLQLIRFLLVGVLNTGFSYSVYAVAIYSGATYIVANLLSAVLGIIFSFSTQGRLVFGNRDGKLFFRFAALWVCIFMAHTMLIAWLIHLGLNAYWAGAAALIPVALLSYLFQKRLVFGSAGTTPSAERVERLIDP